MSETESKFNQGKVIIKRSTSFFSQSYKIYLDLGQGIIHDESTLCGNWKFKNIEDLSKYYRLYPLTNVVPVTVVIESLQNQKLGSLRFNCKNIGDNSPTFMVDQSY